MEETINDDRAGRTTDLRFVMYSHDGVGLGHCRRNLAIAEALSQLAPQCSVLLASGTTPFGQSAFRGNVDFLKLPELRKIENQRYGARRLAISCADILALRSTLLRSALRTFQPDVVLVDKHPLGAGGEMEGALQEIKAGGGSAVLGLRDILDGRETVQEEWFETGIIHRIEEIYDRVLVYGQQEVFDPIVEYGLPGSVAERIRFCGYVVNRGVMGLASDSGFARMVREPRVRPLVLATVGGGEDGFPILRRFIKASKRADWQGAVVAGPLMPREEMQLLQKSAVENGVFFEPFVAGLEGFLGSFDALVCMGGYNTLLEAAAAGVPTLCVPRQAPRREQEIRATLFEQLGLLRMLPLSEISPVNIRREVSGLLRLSSENREQRRCVLDTTGAREAASQLLRVAMHRRKQREECFASEGNMPPSHGPTR